MAQPPAAGRLADLGVRIGLLPSGPRGSVADVPGVGVGHVTIVRDEPDPPLGRGIARTGVTVLDPGGNAYDAPVPAGGAVLNGAGECTGMLQMREWGCVETPVFLTSTMQVGRVFDAAVQLMVEQDGRIGTEDVVIPVVAECDDSLLNDARSPQVAPDDVRAALVTARAGSGTVEEGAVGAGTGMVCLGWKGGIGTASRVLPGGEVLGALVLTNFGDARRLCVGGVPVGARLPDPGTGTSPAGSCIVVLVTDAPLDPAGCGRLAARAGLGLARTGGTAPHGSGEIFLALATGLRCRRGELPAVAAWPGERLDDAFGAAVEATEEAVLRSLLAAHTLTGRAGRTVPALPLDALALALGGAA